MRTLNDYELATVAGGMTGSTSDFDGGSSNYGGNSGSEAAGQTCKNDMVSVGQTGAGVGAAAGAWAGLQFGVPFGIVGAVLGFGAGALAGGAAGAGASPSCSGGNWGNN